MGTRLVGECRFFDSFDTAKLLHGVSMDGQRIIVQFGILTKDNSDNSAQLVKKYSEKCQKTEKFTNVYNKIIAWHNMQIERLSTSDEIREW